MTITLSRRTLIILLVVIFLALSGFLAYRSLFSGTNAAIRHAEAFLFRRMTVAQLGEQGTYRFFFATNRDAAEGDVPMLERFGSNRVEGLKYGYFDTRIEPTLGLGMLICFMAAACAWILLMAKMKEGDKVA